MKTLSITLTPVVVLAGCAQQGFSIKNNVTDSSYSQKQTQHFFVSGVGQGKDVDATSVCCGRDNVDRVEVQQTFLNGFLSFLTLGIYTPREARLYCATWKGAPYICCSMTMFIFRLSKRLSSLG